MSTYVETDGVLKPAPSDLPLRVKSKLPLGTYSVGLTPEGWHLQRQADFVLPPKIYGKTPLQTDRILSTFAERKRSTGVLLSGEKGSGKTLLATALSVKAREQGISTLVVNAPYHGESFNSFIQSIDESCVVIFDEFEKVYHDKQWQSELLTLLDGTAVTKKLFVVTTNDRSSVSPFMRNRPGRIFYSLEYETLDLDFIEEYCQDCLENKEHIESVVAVTSLYDRFNFDMLKALVEEMNRYKEDARSALRMLNVRPDFGNYDRYKATYTVAGDLFPAERTDMEDVTGHPMGRDESYCVDFYNMPKSEARAAQAAGMEFKQLAQVDFEIEHMVTCDPRKGKFTYEVLHEGVPYTLTLTKQPRALSNWEMIRAF